MKTSNTIFVAVFTLSLIIFNPLQAAPQVSIIAPFYPSDPLENFIIDLATQGILQESELYLISNNPSDQGTFLIREYQSIFPQIQLIKGTPDDSLSRLINQAIEAASGNFICIMRIEDWRSKKLFDAQKITLEKNESIDVVYTDYYTSYTPNMPTDKADNWYLNELPEFNPCLLYRDIPGPHCMWRKSLYATYGSLKEDFVFHYFWEFWNRCAYKGSRFKKIAADPGTFHFNYFDQKKLLFGPEDFEQSYREEKYIRDQYSSMWGSTALSEKPFVITIPSYKNKDWYKRNLDSVLNQHYTNYRIIYIDDNSPDNVGALVQEYCALIGKEDRINVIINKENVGALANIYTAVHSCKPDEIIILLDGDDWIAHNDVLAYLNKIYQDPNVWLTYGQFQWFPALMPGFVFEMPKWVIEKNCIREYRWITTHLRSFYAGLFQKIKKEDLLYENKFYSAAWDLGIMYPMVEMAGYHTKFIPDILYMYNTANQINDIKVNAGLQDTIDKFIRRKERYQPIDNWRN